MTEPNFTESLIEQAALAWLESVGWRVRNGVEFAPDAPRGERDDYSQVLLIERVQEALYRLNPDLPAEAREDALRRLRNPEGSELTDRNRSFHRLLVDGVPVEYRTPEGEFKGTQARVLDYDEPKRNDWLAVNQLIVKEGRQLRRLDIVLFVNGLPLGILELKNAADEGATIWSAFQQLQTYKADLQELFTFNEILLISDGLTARVGTLTAGREWMKPWKTISGETLADPHMPELQVTIAGVLEPRRLLDLVRDFLVFEVGDGKLVKKMAGYHQFHAVQVAVGETLRACALYYEAHWVADSRGRYESKPRRGGMPGDRRVGVVWHTQGSGKSLTMAFYAGRIVREKGMQNPTLVVLTDRNDLDDQLFATFARCQDLLRQPPEQAASREDLRQKLRVAAGGVVFTTIQKFLPDEKGDRHPLLSDRRNIVVIADEAHRSQYDFIDGLAAHLRDALPHASFIGFTGTPVELKDASTRAVFGDYISIYDMRKAVEDGATVPIYYESRLAALNLDERERPKIDPDFEEATEGEEIARKEGLKSKWAQLAALVGAPRRLELVARDIVAHFEQRLEALAGKAMVVCMSRRICVELYRELVQLRPEWEAPGGAKDDEKGAIKVVMTGSADDPADWQPHIRSKGRREALANRFRDPNDPLKLVLVRDMWLTGFDAPSLHTMYVDKPMRGHGLMQAIARVNRVFGDKPGGLVVDYLGLAHELKAALATYTESGGEGRTAFDQEEAVALLLEKHEVCCTFFGPYSELGGHRVPALDWQSRDLSTPAGRLTRLKAGQEHILAQPDGKERFLQFVWELSQAFALSVPHPETARLRDDVAFFQEVRSALAKRAPGEARAEEDLDHAVRQILSRAVTSEGVIDVFAAAGLPKPDISILSEEFLAEVMGMKERNLAVELLRKLLKGELRSRRTKNLVQSRSFAEMLEGALRRYQNRSIEAAQVIEELIALAREMRAADRRGQELGLNDDELAFYDALETNDSAVQVLGDETLRGIARELVEKVRANVTIDWMMRENVRAQLRVLVKRILRRHGYPPDKQEKATQTVLEQAALLSSEWAMVS